MRILLVLLIAASEAVFAASNEPILASMTWSEKEGFKIRENELTSTPDTVAWANFTNAINETGWSYLEVKTDSRFPDKVQVM